MKQWYRKWQARRFLREILRVRRDTPDLALMFLADDLAVRLPDDHRRTVLEAINTLAKQ